MYRSLPVALVVAVCLCLMIDSCSIEAEKNDSGKIILQVGDISFTEDEYGVFLRKRKERFQKKYKKPAAKDTIKVWQNLFITNAVLLAEANKYGYQNDPEIENKVGRMARTILLQRKGPFYDRCVVQKVKVTSEIRKQALSRMNHEFELEYLRFISHRDMVETLGSDTVFSDVDGFQQAVEKCKSNPDIIYHKTSWLWLSLGFMGLRDRIYGMGQGEISNPLYAIEGIFIFHVRSKTTNLNKGGEKQTREKFIERILKRVEEGRLAYELDKRIYTVAKINIREEVADKFWETIRSRRTSEFDKSAHEKHADELVMSYEIDATVISVTLADFMDYYNNLTLRRHLTSKDLFYYYLRHIAWEAHALQQADELGLRQEREFVINRQLYKNRLIVETFIKDRIGEIREDEIKARYNKDIQRFNLGEYAKVSLFYFSSMEHALMGWRFLEKNKTTGLDTARLKAELTGLVDAEFGIELHYESAKFKPEIIEQIFEQRDHTVGQPFKVKASQYLVFCKEGRIGTRIKPYADVRELLRGKLFHEKYVAEKAALSVSLCNTYKIKSKLASLKAGR